MDTKELRKQARDGIMNAIAWGRTLEGSDYWGSVHNYLEDSHKKMVPIVEGRIDDSPVRDSARIRPIVEDLRKINDPALADVLRRLTRFLPKVQGKCGPARGNRRLLLC